MVVSNVWGSCVGLTNVWGSASTGHEWGSMALARRWLVSRLEGSSWAKWCVDVGNFWVEQLFISFDAAPRKC